MMAIRDRTPLSRYSDAELREELHARAMRVLGDATLSIEAGRTYGIDDASGKVFEVGPGDVQLPSGRFRRGGKDAD